MNDHLGLTPSQHVRLELPDKWPELMNYPEAVFRRQSMRNFVEGELRPEAFSALLKMLCSGDRSREDAQSFHSNTIAVGFLVSASAGLEPGFYLLYRKTGVVALVSSGSFIEQMAQVCLEQSWLANCAVHFLFMTNLKVLEQARGPRGYRHALLAAGIAWGLSVARHVACARGLAGGRRPPEPMGRTATGPRRVEPRSASRCDSRGADR